MYGECSMCVDLYNLSLLMCAHPKFGIYIFIALQASIIGGQMKAERQKIACATFGPYKMNPIIHWLAL